MSNLFVIANPGSCLGCYTCMAGCALVHKEHGLQPFPRLHITHTVPGTMPMQCRHCEDAPCAAVCPVKAIEIKNQMVQLNESLCIGCKLCALACPFGCIEIAGTPAPSVDRSQNGWINPILAGEIGQKTIAAKCDLCCFREEGPTCVQVCPTKTLRAVTSDEFEKIIREKRSENTHNHIATIKSGR